jgi:hypothetical protein
MDPVVCDACGTRFPVTALTEDNRHVLEDQHAFQESVKELQMLLKVQEFYRRYPEAEGRIQPYFVRLLESDDPEVSESLKAGVPFDQIELLSDQLPAAWMNREEDREVVEFLRHNDFTLGPRLEGVSQEVARLKDAVEKVPCPLCQVGSLYVPSEDWAEFNAGDAISYYWPDWHSVDTDGILHVKASGWHEGTHWTGERAINPEDPEYDFWRWLVAQKKYHRVVEESELPVIRKEWSRGTSTST